MPRLAWIILAVLVSLLAGAAVPSSTASASSKVVIDCKDRTDGFYVVGCSKNFTECHRGTAYKKQCPSHLYFAVMFGRCEIMSDIPECRNPKAVDGKILQSPPEFSCVNRTDGFYTHPSHPCDKSYYVCLKENVMRMACGYQQFFDDKSNRCEFKSRVPACKGTKIAGDSNPYGQSPLPQDGPMPPAPPSEETDGSINLNSSDSPPDCSTKEDGVYTDQKTKCTSFFYKCAHKKLFKYTCQKGLFFDTEAVRCDHKQFVPNCGGVRQMTTAAPAPAQDAAQSAFDCAGKSDGYHTKEPCSREFYTCLAGVGVKQICNDGLLFDSRVGYCDYPLACQGARTTTPRPPPAEVVNAIQSDSAKPRARPPPVNFDCQKHGDGNHQLGKCQKDYIMCSNGHAKQHSCPADLVFNGQQCDYLAGCLSPPSTTAQPPLPPQSPPQMSANPYGNQQQSQPVVSNTQAPLPPSPPPATLPPRDQPSAPAVLFNCSGISNGAHAAAQCSENYFDCWNGVAYARQCPVGLHFNPYAGYCDYPGSAPGCGGQDVPRIPTTLASPTQAPIFQSQPFQRNGGQPAQSPPQIQGPAPKTPESRKCSGLSNGKYAEGCSSYFYNCVYGQTYKTECPEGLFYSLERDMCDLRTTIRACGGQEPQLQQPLQPQQPQQPQQSPPQQQQPYPYQQQTSQQSSSWSSRRLSPANPSVIPGAEANPVYGQGAMASDAVSQVGTECTDESVKNPGCNPYYFRCLNGRLDRVFCAPGLYYDRPSHKCDRMNKIVACGGSPDESNDISATQAPIPLPLPTGTDTFCTDKDTGFFGVGCNTYGYACVSGATLKFNCPAGVYFNPETNKCDWKEHIPACGGSSPVTTTASPQPETPMLPVVEGANAADAPQLPPFCEKLADGYYGDGCNKHFYYCRNKQTEKMSCPAGLFYNIQKKKCQLKTNVPACNPQTIAQSPPAPAPPAAQAPAASWTPYSQLASPAPARSTWAVPTQSAPPAPPPAQDFDCSNKEDGLYSLPECSPMFIQCYSKQKVQQKCQDGLFYNHINGMCDYAERIVACGGSLPSTTPAPTTAQPPQPAQPAQASDAVRQNVPYPASLHKVQADTPMDASCAGKADGYYADGCSERYYSCIAGTLHQHKCQPLLKFHEKDAVCDYEQAVPACQSSSSSSSSGSSNSASSDVPQGPAPPAVPTSSVPNIETLPTFTCRGKTDGDYRLFPCSRNYIKCVDGRYQLQACPGELRFDGKTRRCDAQARVDTCERLTNTQPAAPAPPVRSTWSAQPAAPAPLTGTQGSAQVAAPPAPPVAPSSSQTSSSSSGLSEICQGKDDGFYNVEACSSKYVSCSNGVGYPGVCPEQLVFDIVSGLCEYPLNIASCGSAPSSGSNQPTQPPVQQSPPVQSTWSRPSGQAPAQQQNYGNQQQPQQASQPIQTVQPIQPSLPSQPVQSQVNQLPTRGQNYNPNGQQQPQAQPQLAEFNCNGQADGIYGAKCMTEYFKCSGGVTFQQKCSAGSVFDGVSGGCDFPAKAGCPSKEL